MKIVFIGGVGGSGTRVVADILQKNGVFIGSNLNVSLDNLDWPGQKSVIKDTALTSIEKVEALRLPFIEFIKEMKYNLTSSNYFSQSILAIKVPGSFFYLPYLCKYFDDISYVHVMRHGLDMAFSSNKNQLRNWGSIFDLDCSDAEKEKYQFKYWLKANEYAIDTGHNLLGDNFHVVKFESLCDETESEVNKLFCFLGEEQNISESVFEKIKRPESFQRYKKEDLSIFDLDDLNLLQKFGYGI